MKNKWITLVLATLLTQGTSMAEWKYHKEAPSRDKQTPTVGATINSITTNLGNINFSLTVACVETVGYPNNTKFPVKEIRLVNELGMDNSIHWKNNIHDSSMLDFNFYDVGGVMVRSNNTDGAYSIKQNNLALVNGKTIESKDFNNLYKGLTKAEKISITYTTRDGGKNTIYFTAGNNFDDMRKMLNSTSHCQGW